MATIANWLTSPEGSASPREIRLEGAGGMRRCGGRFTWPGTTDATCTFPSRGYRVAGVTATPGAASGAVTYAVQTDGSVILTRSGETGTGSEYTVWVDYD